MPHFLVNNKNSLSRIIINIYIFTMFSRLLQFSEFKLGSICAPLSLLLRKLGL